MTYQTDNPKVGADAAGEEATGTIESRAQLRQRALELVREHYEIAGRMRNVSLGRLNRSRPPSLRYHRREEVEREWLAMAGAVSTFAVNLGLITPDEDRQVILDFQVKYPERD
jgi:hypothetical protein